MYEQSGIGKQIDRQMEEAGRQTDDYKHPMTDVRQTDKYRWMVDRNFKKIR